MVSHQQYPDPCHPHYDQNGDELDGRQISALARVAAYKYLEPSLDTFDLTLQRSIATTSSKEHRSTVPVETLARRWGTSVHNSVDTLKKTTQRGLRYLEGHLTRRFRTRQKQLDNCFLKTKMYTDTFFKDKVSARGSTCAQLFVTSEGFVAGKPMKSKAETHEVLEFVCRGRKPGTVMTCSEA
jgi:hypothetical protein